MALNNKITAIAIALVILPWAVSASSLYFETTPKEIKQGDTVVVELKLDTGKDNINAIEGAIDYDSSALQVQEMSTGGSIFSIWPRQPLVTDTISEIFFAGGVPGGFSGEGLVAKFVFLAKKSGNTQIYISGDTDLFLHDGQGTKIKPEIKTAEITVGKYKPGEEPKNAWGQTLANDMESPRNLNIKVGKDASIYDGKYFISFVAIDDESGIDHFEIKEGAGDFKRVEGDYLLNDQSLKSKVMVLAVDKAGNKNVVEFDPGKEVSGEFWALIWKVLAVIVVATIVIIIIRKYAKKNKY
jgi:hypothetical protein